MGEELEIRDFKVRLEGSRKTKVGIQGWVMDSPRGEGQPAALRLERLGSNLAGQLDSFQSLVLQGGRADEERLRSVYRDMVAEEVPGALDPRLLGEQLGRQLFTALFQDDTRDLWRECTSRTDDRAGDGLRLRIVLDPEDREEFEYLAALPWELLRDPRSSVPLCLNPNRPLVRHLVASRELEQPWIEPPLRVLLVAANPKTTTRLGVDEEIEKVLRALAGDDRIEVLEPLLHATPEALRERLRNEPVHVLHFIGHGGFEPGGEGGGLVFEDGKGGETFVSGERLADYLRFARPVLVVLNSCQTSAVPRSSPLDPFPSVAGDLAREGYPAILAMQFAISDQAAIAFSWGFYQALAQEVPIDQAVCRGRIAIRDAMGKASLEWITPTLYLRSPNGEILRWFAKERFEAARQRRVPTIGICSFSHNAHVISEQVRQDRLLSLLPCFDNRHLKPGLNWQTDVWPQVQDFIAAQLRGHVEAFVQMDAHLSIAFGAGWWEGSKGGKRLTFRQFTRGGTFDWHLFSDPTLKGGTREQLWLAPQSSPVEGGGRELAIAVSVAQPALPGVESFVATHLADRIGRIVHLEVAPGAGRESVRSGNHAVRLAASLDRALKGVMTEDERSRPVHVFLAAPVGLAFAIGREARGWGRLQLYEYAFDGARPDEPVYLPSILLDPSTLQGAQS